MGVRRTWAALILVSALGIAGAQVSSRYVGQVPGATSATAAVKNEPFSADVITQYDRALDNGGHIHRETNGKIFRDSQGRLRTETEMPGVQPGAEKYEHIIINDPVQQVIIHLKPKTKTATIYRFGEGIGPTAPNLNAASGQPQTAATGKTKKGTRIHFSPAVPPDTQIAYGAVAGGSKLQPTPEQQPSSSVSTHSGMATIQTTPAQATTESLGSRSIEGVRAIGTRTTRTIESGAMGNDRPIVSVCESWFSPELRTMVMTVSDDGQSGRTTMRLVNLVRSEPSPHLFQVPPDYTVKENAPVTTSAKP